MTQTPRHEQTNTNKNISTGNKHKHQYIHKHEPVEELTNLKRSRKVDASTKAIELVSTSTMICAPGRLEVIDRLMIIK